MRLAVASQGLGWRSFVKDFVHVRGLVVVVYFFTKHLVEVQYLPIRIYKVKLSGISLFHVVWGCCPLKKTCSNHHSSDITTWGHDRKRYLQGCYFSEPTSIWTHLQTWGEIISAYQKTMGTPIHWLIIVFPLALDAYNMSWKRPYKAGPPTYTVVYRH